MQPMGLGPTLRQTSQNGPNLGANLRLMDEFGSNGIVWPERLPAVP